MPRHRPQIEENPLVRFLELDLTNPDSIETVLSHIDFVMQYGEDEEPKEVCVSLSTSATARSRHPLHILTFSSVFAMPLPYRISIGSVEITAARGLG